jgi:Domain of unknown function (DUF4118)
LQIIAMPVTAGRLPDRETAEMTQGMAGSGNAGPDENTPQSEKRQQSSRARLAITLLNLSLIVALTFGATLLTGAMPSAAVLVLYSIPVVLAVLLWNFEQGVIAAFASASAAELFYFAPRFTLASDARRDVMAILIFLAAALLCGCLLDDIHRRCRATRGRLVDDATADHQVLRFGGATRTVPERVAEFLVGCDYAMYCDQCIQDQLGLKWRQQVQLVTAMLAVTSLFRRDSGQCQACNQFKQVIRHVKPR